MLMLPIIEWAPRIEDVRGNFCVLHAARGSGLPPATKQARKGSGR